MKEYIVAINDDEMDCEEIFVGYIRSQKELIRCANCGYFRDGWCNNGKFYTQNFDHCVSAIGKDQVPEV